MKKTLRTALCLLLVVAAVISLSACKKRKSEEEVAVENSVGDFMEAYCSLDFEKMSTFVKDSDAFKNNFEGANIQEVIEKQFEKANKAEVEKEDKTDVAKETDVLEPNTENEALAEKETVNLAEEKEFGNEENLKAIAEIVEDGCDYALRDIKKQGDRYICTVEVRVIDMGSVHDLLDDIDENAIYNDFALEINSDESSRMTLEEKEKWCEDRTLKRVSELKLAAYDEADSKWKAVDIQFSFNGKKWIVYNADELVDLIKTEIIEKLKF